MDAIAYKIAEWICAMASGWTFAVGMTRMFPKLSTGKSIALFIFAWIPFFGAVDYFWRWIFE